MERGSCRSYFEESLPSSSSSRSRALRALAAHVDILMGVMGILFAADCVKLRSALSAIWSLHEESIRLTEGGFTSAHVDVDNPTLTDQLLTWFLRDKAMENRELSNKGWFLGLYLRPFVYLIWCHVITFVANYFIYMNNCKRTAQVVK
ncbi:hypothetical protein TorRG33x02_305910 [Trema orientale]|uniref:Uncharacterized protein n=1 Tax=Trema orientale TaxID=63057 RepID=A0A2P5BWM2_TREOI|nr:hypothetical protein TorRG33x02_305910 [Trema orientale]